MNAPVPPPPTTAAFTTDGLAEALAGVATVGAAGSAATEAAGAAGVAATGAAAGGVPMGNFTPVEVALPDAACRRASSLRFLFNSATRSDCS